jgi:putative ABC transport system permease protein
MLRNYFLTAWRNLVNNKAYSALNILGLSVGMAVALLIGLWIQYQYSYDHNLPDYKNIYQVHVRYTVNGETGQYVATQAPLADALKKEIPEIKYACHTDWMGTHNLAVGEKKVFINGAQAEPDFFNIFPFPAINGNLKTALNDPYSIVLTESTAHSLFGDADPMGKAINFDNKHELIVKAIIRDIPGNSTVKPNYVVPFSYYMLSQEWVNRAATSWHNSAFLTFVRLQPGVTDKNLKPKFDRIFQKYNPEGWRVAKNTPFLQSMPDWHLYTEFKNGAATGGGFIDYIHLFTLIGLLVLLIACVNFMNLATARSEKRAREVGVRKAMGSRRKDLILQFLVESLVITSSAGVFAVILSQLVMPAFNSFMNAGSTAVIRIPYTQWSFWAIMVAYILITGLLAGSRPAFYLSSFQPVKVLKGDLTRSRTRTGRGTKLWPKFTVVGRSAALPRKILVVLQFSCSIALIISTLLIYQQIQYAKDRPTGYDADRLVMITGSNDITRNYPSIKHDLLATGLVSSITMSSTPITELWNWSGIHSWSGQKPGEDLGMATVDIGDDYFTTAGMRLLQGKGFTGNLAADSNHVILNEAAVARMRYKNPIGQTIQMESGRHLTVIGIVKDALMQSPFDPVEPTFFESDPNADYPMFRLAPTADVHKAILQLQPIFAKYNPAFPFLYNFVDETYAAKFILETFVSRLAALFAGLAIFISCLGLFGLAAYTANQRSREIGIRKVLGATVLQLWLLLSKDFILLVLVSGVVASPIAWYFMSDWLKKYKYAITIGPGVFLLAAAAALLITVVTISFQAIKGALANPTRSLRSE